MHHRLAESVENLALSVPSVAQPIEIRMRRVTCVRVRMLDRRSGSILRPRKLSVQFFPSWSHDGDVTDAASTAPIVEFRESGYGTGSLEAIRDAIMGVDTKR